MTLDFRTNIIEAEEQMSQSQRNIDLKVYVEVI